MKNYLVSLLVLFTCLSFVSCENKEDVPEPGIDANAFFSFKTDSFDYKSEGFYAYASDSDTHIYIYGASGIDIKDAVYLAIPKGFSKGTYTLDEDTYAIASIGDDTYSTLYKGGNGEIRIESYEGVNIKGSFSFSGTHMFDESISLGVREGKFEVKMRR